MPENRMNIIEYFRARIRKSLWVVILLMLLPMLAVPSITSLAEDRDCSVTVHYPWEGITVHLYKIGAVNDEGDYDLDSMFGEYQVDLEATNAADTLAAYVRRDELTADETLLTGADGTVAFTKLQKGVYLILAEEMTTDAGTLVASPNMLELPQWQGDILVYDVQAEEKYEVQPPEATSLTVVKNWKNDDESKRPESITVQLIKDGSIVYDEAVLTKECSWAKTWPSLEGGHVWTVVEKEVPKGYKVTISTSGDKKAIINTSTENPPKNPPGKLPQTGQNWWLVPMLIAVGLFLILLGLLLRPDK